MKCIFALPLNQYIRNTDKYHQYGFGSQTVGIQRQLSPNYYLTGFEVIDHTSQYCSYPKRPISEFANFYWKDEIYKTAKIVLYYNFKGIEKQKVLPLKEFINFLTTPIEGYYRIDENMFIINLFGDSLLEIETRWEDFWECYNSGNCPSGWESFEEYYAICESCDEFLRKAFIKMFTLLGEKDF